MHSKVRGPGHRDLLFREIQNTRGSLPSSPSNLTRSGPPRQWRCRLIPIRWVA